jgi:hypothetical protein
LIDSATNELLSRYVDGDLDDDEVLAFEARLDGDSQLEAELDALRRLTGAITEIAEAIEPPGRLDPLMETLRRATPHARARAWVQGLAAAAGVVLAATVVVEVARTRDPGTAPTIRDLRQVPRDSGEPEVFQLQPLPTSSVPEEEVRLGAADRLVSSPVPEPRLDEPRPLDIVGPLSRESGPDSAPGRVGLPGRLTIASASGPISFAVESVGDLPSGRYRFRVGIENGRVRSVVGADPGTDGLVALRSVVGGLDVRSLADGRYDAELIVGGQ